MLNAVLIASGVTIFNLICVALTLLQLPGLWLMLLCALIVKLVWPGEMFGWPVLGIAAGIALLAELCEFAMGAVGAKSAGASKRGMWGAVVGGIVGAIAGTVMIPVPIIGTLIGAALGSGLVAAGFELTHRDAKMDHAVRVAGGAAVGRFAASVVKLGFAAVLAVVLSWAAWVT